MPTAVENAYVFAKLEELEPAQLLAPPGATDDGRKRFDVRRHLGITAFGVQAFSAPSGVVIVNEHDETLLVGDTGQEELYIVLKGSATFEIDGETVDAPTGALVQVQPAAKRKATATEDGTTILVVGATAGEAYKVPPEEVAEAFAAYNAGDYEEALAKQLVVVGKQPDNPVFHFNAGCFAARAGRADEAIEHLGRAVEINEGVKELMATDEDLDSIREDPRFIELAK
jgi:mannose-6-phosphate isomerase-like protein (cupin superfamily)